MYNENKFTSDTGTSYRWEIDCKETVIKSTFKLAMVSLLAFITGKTITIK